MQDLHDSVWMAFSMVKDAVDELWPETPIFDRSFGSEKVTDSQLIPEIWDSLSDHLREFLYGAHWEKSEVQVKAGIGGPMKGSALEFLCVMGRVGEMPWQPLTISVESRERGISRTGIFKPKVTRSFVVEMAPAD